MPTLGTKGRKVAMSGRGWLLDTFKNIYFDSGPDPPGIHQISRERWPRTPQMSSNNPRQSVIFEAGVGDRLATLRVSRAKR